MQALVPSGLATLAFTLSIAALFAGVLPTSAQVVGANSCGANVNTPPSTLGAMAGQTHKAQLPRTQTPSPSKRKGTPVPGFQYHKVAD